MRLGVHVVGFGVPGGPAALADTLAEVGRAADQAGVDTLSLMDHHFQLEFLGDATEPMLEGYTTLGFLAAHTSTVTLQLLMTGVTYRHPGILAKTVSSLDVLSGGRAALGIGAAWYEREHRGLGVPFPPLAERFERLDETLQIVRQMWSDGNGPFHGRHFDLAETICSPQPLSRVPIMVGGGGEKKTLRLVARYADACNVFAGRGSGADQVAHKLAVLREWCEREGRPYDDIRRTVLWNGPISPDAAGGAAFVEEMRALADVGVQDVHVMPLPPTSSADPVGFVRALGEHVVPTLGDL
jgi:F420-dependent oxidoreductase-like protein